MHGICHIEIPAKDFARIGKFYADVFGWGTENIPEMDYMMFKPPDGVSGGFDKNLTIADVGGITLYIEVEEVDTILKKVEENGGKTLKPKTEIPGVGHIAYFADIEGNRIGLWSK
ncbi:MAG: VOC family protein [Candidatus Zixiibacteriota bacterium]|nr:MAG: VOC family protein [candidate division Zixibacteria bacterium]